MPTVGIERIDLDALHPVVGQQRHQRSRSQQIRDQEWACQHQTNTSRGGGKHSFDASGDEVPSYARDHGIAGGIFERPLVWGRNVG